MQVLTFDFHNTLANCDPWFDLEVRDLPWAVIEHLGIATTGRSRTDIDTAYRLLRQKVVASGNEIDAYDAVGKILAELNLETEREIIRNAVDDLMHRSIHHIEPVPGAIDAVRHVHATGVKLGVVSSAVHHLSLDRMLERMGIAACFDTVVTSASCGFYKSTPAIYAAALGQLGGHPASSIHIGDSLRWDVATAQEAGMTAVWLQTARHDVFAADAPRAEPSLTLTTMVQAGPKLVDLLNRVRLPADA